MDWIYVIKFRLYMVMLDIPMHMHLTRSVFSSLLVPLAPLEISLVGIRNCAGQIGTSPL